MYQVVEVSEYAFQPSFLILFFFQSLQSADAHTLVKLKAMYVTLQD